MSTLLTMHLAPLDGAVIPSITMNLPSSRRSRSSTPADAVDFTKAQELARTVLPSSSVSLYQLERLPSSIHRLHLLRLTDGKQFVLKCPPGHDTRRLEIERYSLETEAQVLDRVQANAPDVPLPRRIKYDSSANSIIARPYLLRGYIPGTRLSDVIHSIPSSERTRLDRALGEHLRDLSTITAPSFGSARRVSSGHGSRTWAAGFSSLLESILRDGEDILVSIPYESIRYYTAIHSHHLDHVETPRLVALDVGLPSNIIVDGRSKSIVGLLGFDSVVWGDPMMGGAFADASDAFWEGFGMCPARNGPERIRQLL